MTMTLHDWLISTGTPEKVFAAAIGRSQACVNRYRRGLRIPSQPDLIKIYRYTRGAVTPNDFYALPPLGEAAA